MSRNRTRHCDSYSSDSCTFGRFGGPNTWTFFPSEMLDWNGFAYKVGPYQLLEDPWEECIFIYTKTIEIIQSHTIHVWYIYIPTFGWLFMVNVGKYAIHGSFGKCKDKCTMHHTSYIGFDSHPKLICCEQISGKRRVAWHDFKSRFPYPKDTPVMGQGSGVWKPISENPGPRDNYPS